MRGVGVESVGGWERPSRSAGRVRAARTWLILAILAPLGMLVLSGLMLLDLRRDAWDKAEQTSKNLLQVIERDIARNMEIIDLSLRAVVDNLRAIEGIELDRGLRQLILFDRAATARDMGVMLVVDANGDIVSGSQGMPARRINNADRAYFQAHKAHSDLGLTISPPLMSRLLDAPVIVLSRRINRPDGSFGGLVSASLKLSYFSRLFDQIGLGRDGAINLYLRDGTRLMRHPFAEDYIGTNVAGSPTFARFVAARSGSFTAMAIRGDGERYYAFTQIGHFPLVLNVALSTAEIEAEWREKALVIGLAVLFLCGLTILLSLLFGRELGRRAAMQVELARLSRTDTLTGLSNRRHFEETFARARATAQRTGRPLALLVADADHFKRYNDMHGHAGGDAVLRKLAEALTACLRRPGDLAARIGGEEFTVLLPETDREGALHLAGAIHAAVAGIAVPSAGIPAGTVTVSIGLAVGTGGGSMDDLFTRADAALYAAKRDGRNRTCCAQTESGRPEEAPVRVVPTPAW